jgi:multisubunit Na+/H+ antiporter MnhG subunit
MPGHTPHHSTPPPPWWKTRTGAAFIGFLAIAAFFLITEHQAHVLGALPLLLLLLCPLLHLFGHGSHRHGRGPEEKP